MDKHTPIENSSLFQDHLTILGLDDQAGDLSPRQLKEKERMEELVLPPLTLPESKSVWQTVWQWLLTPAGGSAALAAVAALFVAITVPLKVEDETGLKFKGTYRVNLYFERQGEVRPLEEKVTLSDGDKVGATVIAAEKSVAFWMVTDDQLKVLSDSDEVVESRITLEPGVRQSFKSSFELVAPNEGEFLVVVVCPLKVVSDVADKVVEFVDLDQALLSKLSQGNKVDQAGCHMMGRRLRVRGTP